MSVLDDVKAALRVTGDDHDALLTRLIASGLAEFNTFAGGNPAGSADAIPADAFTGLVLMVRADFDGDPEKRNAYRAGAISLWRDYRANAGGL